MKGRFFALISGCLILLSFPLTDILAQQQTSPATETQRNRPKLRTPNDDRPADQELQQKGQEDATIKLDTVLVNLPVIVTDRDGKFIPNLTKKNFQIYEDGVKQNVDTFGSVEVPVDVVLVLDTSGSTRFKLEDIQQAALAFIEKLRPQDRVMIVSFDTKVYVETEFTSDRRKMRRAIFQTRTGGATRLYDAIDLVITERLNKIEGRKAIVLFTDGVDTASRLTTALESVEMVEESNALVYTIQYDTMRDVQGPAFIFGGPIRRPQGRGAGASLYDYDRADHYLNALAERSGARLHKADTLEDIDEAFTLIAEELRHQYTLSYYPTNDKRDGSYRKIRVVIDKPSMVVRARKGYRAAEEQ